MLQWLLSNPEKGALFLVLLAGAWTWIKELRGKAKTDDAKEDFLDTLIRENKELRGELREERRKSKRRSNDDPDSGRPT
jgi:hypothetical protein